MAAFIFLYVGGNDFEHGGELNSIYCNAFFLLYLYDCMLI